MPSFRETPSLEKLLPEMIHFLEEKGYEFQISIVNDLGYPDAELEQMQERFSFNLINNPYNLGSQKAVVHGLKTLSESNSDEIFIIMDADGQDDYRAIPQLVENTDHHQIALAQRVGKRPEPFAFRFFYALYKLFFHFFAGVTPDFGNYCAFDREIARRISVSPLFNVTFSLCLPLISQTKKVPVPRLARIDGSSRVGYNGLFLHAVQSLLPYLDKIAIRTAFGSAFIGGIGGLLITALVGLKLFATQYVMPNWVTIVTVGVILLAVQLLVLCVILFLTASLYKLINYHTTTR